MKIRITKEAKKWLTLAQAPIARKMVQDGKDPDVYGGFTNEELVMSAANAFLSYHADHGAAKKCGLTKRVLEATAEICNNQRLDDYYLDGSGIMDVWVEGIVKCYTGYLEIGAYLSDIFALGPDEARETLVNHCNAYVFAECK